MYLEVIDSQDKVLRKLSAIQLDIDNIRYDLIHQVVVWQQSKARKPISHTKGISEVQGSTRKIYKQKGTGRARHGSNRVVQFVGGAVVFGPTKNKNHETKINKKVRRLALLNALSLKCKEKSLFVRDSLNLKSAKYKDFYQTYGDIVAASKKPILFVDNQLDLNFIRSSKNCHKVNLIPSIGLNVLDIIRSEKIFFSENAFKTILGRFE